MKQLTTYIFDLDGTLLDTLSDLVTSVNYALAHHNMPVRTTDEVRAFVGNGVENLILRAVPQDTPPVVAAEVLDTFRKYYILHSEDSTMPYPGIISLLEQLKQRGIKTAVVSNKFHAATQALCNRYFGSLIDVAVGEGNGIRRKPEPDGVIEVMRQLGATAEESVYIGDSDVDILTAKNANISCVSVLWGFRDAEFLQCNGAMCFVSEPLQLLDI